jgi:hypothetical protein
MPSRGGTAIGGAVMIALLVLANVSMFQRRQAALQLELVASIATATQPMASDSLRSRSSVLAPAAVSREPPPPPPPLVRVPRQPPPPPPPVVAAAAAAPPVGTGTSTGCLVGMQLATDPALAIDPSSDCKKRHVFANGIQACHDHVRVQQGRYSKVNLHEPSEEELLSRALALIRPGDVFVDVGAAVGYYTLLVASTHPEARVYGFNPSEWFRKQMAHNVRLNFGIYATKNGLSDFLSMLC